MSLETERLVGHTPPTQEQLHKLASIGMSSAAERERIRRMSPEKRAHFFHDQVDFMGEVMSDDIDPSRIRHRVGVRVGVRPATKTTEKIWSLKYFSTYYVETAPGVWPGERTLHRFEWTRSRVLLAERTFRLVGVETPRIETVDDAFERFSMPDDAIEILHASNQLQQITRDDCDELIADMSEYFDVVNAISRS